jgi:hypothetical protein
MIPATQRVTSRRTVVIRAAKCVIPSRKVMIPVRESRDSKQDAHAQPGDHKQERAAQELEAAFRRGRGGGVGGGPPND